MSSINEALPVRHAYHPTVTTLNRVAATALIISLIAACVLVPWIAGAAGATLTTCAVVIFTASTATTLLSATAALIVSLYQRLKVRPAPVLAVQLPPVERIPSSSLVLPSANASASMPPPAVNLRTERTESPQLPLAPPSSPSLEASSDAEAAGTFTENLNTLRIALNAMSISEDVPDIGIGQSFPELRASVPGTEEIPAEIDSEDTWSFPELFNKATATLRNLTEVSTHLLCGVASTPESAIRVKASKYEALMNTINSSLRQTGLPPIHLPEKVDVYNLEYLDAIRRVYENTLEMLRVGNNPEYHKVCSDLYTQTDLSQENTNLLSLLRVQSMAGGTDIWDYLRQVCHILNHAPAELTTAPINRWARSALDWRGLNFSPLNAGNPPQDLVHLRFGEQSIKVLGMGSPTLQGWNPYPASIDPIFKNHLLHLQGLGQRHFYVSNQNHKDEQVRNREIMNLQEMYPEAFVAITCAKNTSFYKGNGPDEKALFETELYNQFFVYPVEQSGCYLPPRLRNSPEFQSWAKATVGAISAAFFTVEEKLNVEERKFFIELFYNCLTLKVMIEEKISYINFTCKDGIDRGMGSLGWFLFLLLKNAKLESSPDAVKLFLEVFFTRAFWTRKRNIIEERFLRVAEDMHTWSHLDPSGEKARRFLNTLFPWIANLQVEL